MFYSFDLLSRRGGRFGKIWLAAQEVVKLTRRDIAGVSVTEACEDILKYIMNKADPLRAGGARPRFSLYLSSQLMYGVVKIHRKQSEYLLADATGELLKVRSAIAALNAIDLMGPHKTDQVTIPEPHYNEGFDLDVELFLAVDTEAETSGALAFWGIDTTSISASSVPYSPLSDGSSAMRRKREKSLQSLLGSPNTVRSLDEITMQEKDLPLSQDRLGLLQVPPEEDLILPFPEEINLAAQNEPKLTADDLNTTTPRGKRQRPRKDQASSLSSSDIAEPAVTPKGKGTSQTGVPETRAVPPSPGVTQPIITSPFPRRLEMDTFQLPPVTPSSTRRKRKRQLLFVDPETQIPMTELNNVMKSGRQETCENRTIPDTKLQSADTLMKNPVRKALRSKGFLPLWRRNAVTRTGVSDAALDALYDEAPLFVTSSSDESSVLRGEQPMVSLIEKSMELLREGNQSTSANPVGLADSLNLETPKQVLQDSRTKETSRRKGSKARSLTEEDEQSSVHSSHLSVADSRTNISGLGLDRIQEEQASFIPEAIIPEVETTIQRDDIRDTSAVDDLRERMEMELGEEDATTFAKLYPPRRTTRQQAALGFQKLLEMCASGNVVAYQREPYSDILLTL